MAPGVGQDPLQEGLRPGSYAERLQGRQLGRVLRPPQEGSFGERTHHHHPEAELVRGGEDPALHVALPRVVRDLHRGDPPGAHDLLELLESRGTVVRGTHGSHQPLLPEPLEHGELLRPGQQVVHLVQVDPTAEPLERPPGLRAPLGRVRGPHLRGYQGGIAPPLEGRPQHPLGLAVHRRRVEQPGPEIQGHIHHPAAGPLLPVPADVERVPRPHPHDGHTEPRGTELPILHRGEPYPGPRRTMGRARRWRCDDGSRPPRCRW
jgi:hypothetical protein